MVRLCLGFFGDFRQKYNKPCPFSNSVIGGFRPINKNRFSYESIKKRKLKLINKEVSYVDSEKKIIKFLNNESIKYDWLVISPGVDYKWDEIIGYNQVVNTSVPHGWNGRDALWSNILKLYFFANSFCLFSIVSS